MTTVLFTGGGGAGSEALARLLAPRYEVHFADADQDARPHGIAEERWHVIPRASADEFIPALVALWLRFGMDLLVPGVDEELSPIADHRWMPTLLPPTSFVAAHLDKLASYELLRDAGIQVPATVEGGMFPQVPLPWVIKPRTGRGSRGVMMARDWNDAVRHRTLLYDDHIVQEQLIGDEYTVTVAADADGWLRAVVPCKIALKRGITIRASTHHDSAVTETCRAIHEAYPVPGCYNVQGIKGADGVFRPFEINPRVSTTLCLAIAAGVDPIAIYLGHQKGDGLLPFEDGLTLSRSWHNEFTHAPVLV